MRSVLSRPGVVFALLAAASAWLCATVPVFSQEAYYWTYAQHPALSYFDHPPMVAWLIWLGTSLFGDGAFGLRFGTWVCGLGTMWFGLQLLREFGIGREGQAAWMLLGLASPILVLTHFLTNPDPPLVCFWTLTMLALWRARSGSLGWWLAAGLAAGCALLSKYSAAFLAISGVVLLLADAPMRRELRRPGPYLAVLVAALVFLPVVAWNVNNDFESFRFQTEGRYATAEFGLHWFAQLAGGQFGLIHPMLALLLPASLWWLGKRLRQHDPRALWLLAFGLPLPLYLLATSLWIQVKANWLAPAYVPLLLAMVVWWRESGVAAARPRLLRFVAGSLLVLPLALPMAPLLRLVPPGRGSSWTGWEEIAQQAEIWEDRVDPADGIEGNFFFFAADYRDAAQLGRSLLILRRTEDVVEHPEVASLDFEPTMAQNVLGKTALQYDHWNSPTARIGQDAIFVLPRPDQREEMVRQAGLRFDRIEKVERMRVSRLGIQLLEADIYLCHGYRGPLLRP